MRLKLLQEFAFESLAANCGMRVFVSPERKSWLGRSDKEKGGGPLPSTSHPPTPDILIPSLVQEKPGIRGSPSIDFLSKLPEIASCL